MRKEPVLQLLRVKIHHFTSSMSNFKTSLQMASQDICALKFQIHCAIFEFSRVFLWHRTSTLDRFFSKSAYNLKCTSVSSLGLHSFHCSETSRSKRTYSCSCCSTSSFVLLTGPCEETNLIQNFFVHIFAFKNFQWLQLPDSLQVLKRLLSLLVLARDRKTLSPYLWPWRRQKSPFLSPPRKAANV